MDQNNTELNQIIHYIKSHWPSKVKQAWQVGIDEYPDLLKQVIQDFTKNKTKGYELIRIAGLSGSGKTTQLLPAAEEYFRSRKKKPVLIAAREFVPYHPHFQEIKEFYGAENVRKYTDEFSTIMMFLSLSALIKGGYDIILDVTLLDPTMEAILIKLLNAEAYQSLILMIAVSPKVTEKFLGQRSWRHAKATELEFIRATELALRYYADQVPELKIIVWNVYLKDPVYAGPVKNVLPVFKQYSELTNIPPHDEAALREAKIKYFKV